MFKFLFSVVLISASLSTHAAIDATYVGTWQNDQGKTLKINAQEVSTYSQHANVCKQNEHYVQKSESFDGLEFKTQMQSDLEGQQYLLGEWSQDEEMADVLPDLKHSIATTQQALPLVLANQTYSGIVFECIDNATHLLFLSPNQALEKTYMGGEVFYHLYQK